MFVLLSLRKFSNIFPTRTLDKELKQRRYLACNQITAPQLHYLALTCGYEQTLTHIYVCTYRKNNVQFAAVITRLQESPQCQRLPFMSFLLLPFQRITRIKMLTEVKGKFTGQKKT